MTGIYDYIAAHIERTTGGKFTLAQHRSVSGGCINQAVVLQGHGQCYFVKLNQGASPGMFEAEVEGLRALQACTALRAPTPVCWGAHRNIAYLVLEYIELGRGGTRAQQQLGRGLAELHRITAPQFGWHRDNTIGATPQINTRAQAWVEFLRKRRLGFQLGLAAGNGLSRRTTRAGELLMARLDGFFSSYSPVPSLLHGDLWSGNFSADASGQPVIYDPAVYFGDREADVAMTELFGGFTREFYDAYGSAWAMDDGYITRKTLYNLYHVLNHFNLFGGGYDAQVNSMIHQLLAELG